MSYSSTLGRWMQQDPAGYVDGMSLQEYLSSNPVNKTDPAGLQAAPPKRTAPPTTRPATRPAPPMTRPASRPATQPALTWADFQGMPPGDDQAEDAHIAMELSTNLGRPTYTTTEITCGRGWSATARYADLSVTATLNRAQSWVRRGEANDALLKHELQHLRISQVGAARATTKLRLVKGTGIGANEPAARAAALTDLNEKIQTAFNDSLLDVQGKQDAYDEATDHGRDADEQRKWEQQLDAWQSRGTW